MTKLPGELLPYEKDDDVCPKIKINFEFSLACGKDAIFTRFSGYRSAKQTSERGHARRGKSPR